MFCLAFNSVVEDFGSSGPLFGLLVNFGNSDILFWPSVFCNNNKYWFRKIIMVLLIYCTYFLQAPHPEDESCLYHSTATESKKKDLDGGVKLIFVILIVKTLT